MIFLKNIMIQKKIEINRKPWKDYNLLRTIPLLHICRFNRNAISDEKQKKDAHFIYFLPSHMYFPYICSSISRLRHRA